MPETNKAKTVSEDAPKTGKSSVPGSKPKKGRTIRGRQSGKPKIAEAKPSLKSTHNSTVEVEAATSFISKKGRKRQL